MTPQIEGLPSIGPGPWVEVPILDVKATFGIPTGLPIMLELLCRPCFEWWREEMELAKAGVTY